MGIGAGMETFEQKFARVTAETVDIAEYNPAWPGLFEQECEHLLGCLPSGLIVRIEHFGSTAVPGLCAKPIVDLLIEISDVEWGKTLIPEVLETQGYDCFWRPLGNEDVPPYYTWGIKRDEAGHRSHHLHFVEPGFKDDDLRFRDILREDPAVAEAYGQLKRELATQHHDNRVAYGAAKGEFIRHALEQHRA